MVTFTIDGKIVEAEEGTTVLQVAKENNIDIPTLCYHEALEPSGACRLCVVEVTSEPMREVIPKIGEGRLVTACNYPVEENIEVKTNSEEVIAARKLVVELLLARCPNVKSIQDLARDFGIEKPRFRLEDDDCIFCGLCVRICEERMGVSAISFVGRGIEQKVDTPFHIESDVCTACGACAFVCPTGAIKLEDITKHKPIQIPSEFNLGLSSRTPIYLAYPQAIPNVPVIDRDNCAHFLTGKCRVCEAFCPTGAINFDQGEEELVELEVGSVILAAGYNAMEASIRGEYGYGRYPNVITSLEFERILSASGPTEGHIVRPGDQKEPKRIAFIQCVGSRDVTERGSGYCSSVCCMYATKQTTLVKEHFPEVETTIFLIDLRAHGKGYEDYYLRAEREYGVRYIRSAVSSVKEMPQTKNLLLGYISPEGEPVEEEFDLVVLSVGIETSSTFDELCNAVDVEGNEYGFLKTELFSPTDTSREGIFVCGAIQEPKDIPDSVVQASASAARAGEILADVRNTMVLDKEYPPEIDVRAETPRVGVFVCHCGNNIASVVDVRDVAAEAVQLDDVVYAEDILFACSPDGLSKLKQIIKEHQLNRVVVASCSPRTHEPLFRETLRETGLNRYLFEMANIRDQCSWVHSHQPRVATEKSKGLVRSAVAKARFLQPLQRIQLDNTQTGLVIGGGIAGMTAALSLARQGFEVHLVEKEAELGGNFRHVRYTLQGDEPREFLNALIDDVKNHELITLHLSSEVKEVSGFVGNFKTIIDTPIEDETVPSSAIHRTSNEGDKSPYYERGQQLIEHSVVILATGAREYQPEEYCYPTSEKVLTQRELENRIADGNLRLPADSEVVMIQCVGCRNEDRSYCSRICCSMAIKNALKVKEENPAANVYILYKDVRTYGFREKYYQQAREKGVIFIRYDDEHKPKVQEKDGRLEVAVFDPVLKEDFTFEPSLVALSAGIISGSDNEKISNMLMVPQGEDGFFLEAHIKLRPVEFASDGLFVCGSAHWPKFAEESIVQAQAAAAKAATFLSKEKIEVEGAITVVEDDKCVACLTCVRVCPYNVPEINSEKGVAEITPANCHGCGVCVSECPARALQLQQYKDDQVFSMIDALLM
ncbi:TPA: FAD-dependent oxidoreductase [Candidatus Poribacteria bacterium]|nr:FAD-dependent oxidoreductase [Candidatus Poribacteria bacterium]